MAEIIIHHDKITEADKLPELCPFGAIKNDNGRVTINSSCKMCKLCVTNGPAGVFEFVKGNTGKIDKSKWRGVAVWVEQHEEHIHPVAFELLGKARELAAKISQPVYCLLAGSGMDAAVETLREYAPDEIFVYDVPELQYFRIEPYTNVLEDFINAVKPSVILVGGTPQGRSLAPRAAARFRTGLTADCTFLDIKANSDLDQIRPAFGGNIMAHINTPNHRPQFATVRYKMFPLPDKASESGGKITRRTLATDKLSSKIKVRDIRPKPKETSIEDAEVILVAGRGVKKAEDMQLIHDLAEMLDAQAAGTRSLIETGWLDPKRQIGLSGRTVKPKLIITLGVSGAIQFVAGMNGADFIVAVNSDPNAPIFQTAHVGIVGDIYEIIPQLAARITAYREMV